MKCTFTDPTWLRCSAALIVVAASLPQPAGAFFLHNWGVLHRLDRIRRVGRPSPSGFQWPDDYRDPNHAWTGGQKVLFLLLYVAFWAGVVLLAHFWPEVCGRWRRAASARVAPASTTQTGGERVLPLLEEELRLEEELNVGPTPAYPHEKRVIELFEAQASRVPDNTALIIAGQPAQEISYSKLNAAASELCEGLVSMGVSCGTVVALVMDRNAGQVVAVYGVLKSGAAFLPVDMDAPAARKQFLVVESEALAVIGTQGQQSTYQLASDVGIPCFSLPEGGLGGFSLQRPRALSGMIRTRSNSNAGEWRRPEADDMALLIYTSGTTGTPKGIVYDQQHLMHGVYFFGFQCNMNAESVGLLKSPYFWAIFEWEMFPALTLGAKLVVASATGHKSPEYLARTISTHQVSVLMITPQVLDLVLDIHESSGSAQLLRPLEHIVTVGEPLPCVLANRAVRMRGLGAQVHNFYGASESSCTVYTVPDEGIDLAHFPNKAPAGLPQPHVQVYVMVVEEGTGTRLAPVQTGESGEICFGGVLAACYWKHEELTLQKWIETERYGRLYRTGDLGRWRRGVLEVVGRTDRQVKIRGVRVEPEEVEAVLKRFTTPPVDPGTPETPGGGVDVEEALPEASPNMQRAGLKEVAVVASKEPSELVAFVTKREGAGTVTTEALRAHCQANLTPAYVPKFFVIVEELPKLPNGKTNLSILREQASQHTSDEGQVVMDSLGQMKRLSKWAIFENAVIHRCYAYWMVGVLLDHYMRCAADAEDSNNAFYPFCTPLARRSVRPWTEVLIRAFGNDQDMFGFIMLGAYQDSRPDRPGGLPRVRLGLKDLFIFAVYLCMALPIPQVLHLIFRSWAWPHSWGDKPAPENVFGWEYMQRNSYTSDHRWYLEMVLEARIFLQICEKLRLPGWLQGLLATAPCFLPKSVFEGEEYAFDVCENVSAPTYVLYVFSWLFRNWGDGCAIYWVWIQWYFAFYVWCFHFLRPLVQRAERFLPKGRTWAAASLACSMVIGMLMALFHYPNDVLENGTGIQWAPLEVGADILQPSLLALGMTHLPLNLEWWGNTTLGCYVFHFYFRDEVTALVLRIGSSFAWDPTGLLLFFVIVALCLCVTTFLGPLGHYVLLSPTFLYARVRRVLAARRRTAEARRVELRTYGESRTS